MKHLAYAVLLVSLGAGAATVYQDRPVPVSAPCLVLFDGRWINASGIQDITVGDYTGYRDSTSRWGTFPEPYPYKALRVTMLNRQFFEVKDASRFTLVQADLLLQIGRCNSPK